MRAEALAARREAAAVRAITDYMFPAERLLPAAVGLVLGMSRPERPVARALQLYREGRAQRLLFSGGYNARLGATEGEVMAEAARQAGIPDSDILVDPTPTNTLANIAGAGRFVALGEAVVLVAIHYHARRALLTAKALLGRTAGLGVAVYPSLFYGPDDWHVSARGRGDVMSELEKIARYFPGEPEAQLLGALAAY